MASGNLHPACGPPLLVVDAHVHIYCIFDLSGFLDVAFSNCSHVARHFGCDQSYIPILLLAEGHRQREFHRLREMMDGGKARIAEGKYGGYRLFPTEEAESLRIERTDGALLFLIAGFQIVTSEQLEVLALATVSEIPDGLSLEKTVAVVEKDRAVPVIPWGFGKWSGRRGDVLKEFLASSTVSEIPDGLSLEQTVAVVEKDRAVPVIPWGFGKWSGRRRRVLMQYLASRREGVFFLGDNGGRPCFLRFPDFQRLAPGGSLKVLPGSDALPLSSELKKVGCFGFTLQEKLDMRRPGDSLKQILSNPGVVPIPYGPPESITRFARNQMILRLWKHRI